MALILEVDFDDSVIQLVTDIWDLPGFEGALRQELRGLLAPELRITGTGAFPGLARPRVLWAGLEELEGTGGRLAALRNRVWQAALAWGWRPSAKELGRTFAPHLTLARVRERQGKDLARDWGAFAELVLGQRWTPPEVVLFESRPDSPEERYRRLASVPLAVEPR